MPFILAVFFGFYLEFLALRWLWRKRVIAAARLVLLVILQFLALGDFLATAPLYLMGRVLWPPLHPQWTWLEWAKYLARVPAGQTAPQWWFSTLWLFKHRPVGFWATQVPWAAILYPLLRWAWLSGWPARRGEPEAARSATHGSARWRKPGELKATMTAVKCDAPAAGGIVAGSDAGRSWVTRPDVGNPHVLIIGATRSGKSRRVILPTIWTLGHAGESMVLTDPKGELYAHTAAWLRQRGYNVVLLDLLHPARGNRWNPYAAITKAHDDGDDEEASRLAWEMGNMLAWAAGPGSDPIWPQAEESLIAALSLAVALEAPSEARHPASAYRMLIDLGADGGFALDSYFVSLPAGHPARLAYGTAALSESRTRSSIYTGTAAHMRLWGEPGIAWLSAASDHDPGDAGRKPTAIFLLLPDEAGARKNIASLYVNQAYSALAGLARENGGRLPVPVWFLLDEFGNIGKLPNIAEKLTVAAGRGIRWVMAVQSTAQLSAVYGDKVAEIVMGNCDTWLYLRAADLETARAISAKAGTYTVKTSSVSRRALGPLQGTESATGRPLLTPDEVLRWPGGQSLVLQAGQFPARLPLGDLSAWKAANAAFQPVPLAPSARASEVPTWVPAISTESPVEEGVEDEPAREAGEGWFC